MMQGRVIASTPMPKSYQIPYVITSFQHPLNTLISQVKSLIKSMRLNSFNALRDIIGLSDVKERLMSHNKSCVT